MAVRTIRLDRSALEDNDLDARRLRGELAAAGTFLVNLMSSPGAGKTTFLLALLERLCRSCSVGVMEADLDSDVDARKVEDSGLARTVQLHTGGMCHLDAAMTRQGLEALGTEGLDIVFLENVGNLVCPAEFDTGACLDIMLLSVSEGDDKPIKYPLVFGKCEAVFVTKMDAAPYFSFDLERCERNIRARNPRCAILPVSARTGAGMDAATAWILRARAGWKESRNA